MNHPFRMHEKLNWLRHLRQLSTNSDLDSSFLARAEAMQCLAKTIMTSECHKQLDFLWRNQSGIEDVAPRETTTENTAENNNTISGESTGPACEHDFQSGEEGKIIEKIPELDEIIGLIEKNKGNSKKNNIKDLANISLKFERSHDSIPLPRPFDEDFEENEKTISSLFKTKDLSPKERKEAWEDYVKERQASWEKARRTGRVIHGLSQKRRS